MRDRNFDYFSGKKRIRKSRIGIFRTEVNPFTAKLERFIANKHSREQSAFTENLKTVANADDSSTVFCKTDDIFHDRRKSRDCTGAQIISVRKSAGKNDEINSFANTFFFMPDEFRIR